MRTTLYYSSVYWEPFGSLRERGQNGAQVVSMTVKTLIQVPSGLRDAPDKFQSSSHMVLTEKGLQRKHFVA